MCFPSCHSITGRQTDPTLQLYWDCYHKVRPNFSFGTLTCHKTELQAVLCTDSSGNVLVGCYLAWLGESELLQKNSLSCRGKLDLSLNMKYSCCLDNTLKCWIFLYMLVTLAADLCMILLRIQALAALVSSQYHICSPIQNCYQKTALNRFVSGMVWNENKHILCLDPCYGF